MKFKLFTFLKENNILVEVKTKLLKVVKDKKADILPKLEDYIKEKSPIAKEKLVKFIVNKIDLPFYLKIFKPIIKKVVDKNIDKLELFIIEQINNI